MGEYVASEVVKCMIKKGINVCNAKVLNLGITFKENCPDVRNTKAVDVIRSLEDYGINVATFDPWANPAEVLRSEERRVGKECRCRWGRGHVEEKRGGRGSE